MLGFLITIFVGFIIGAISTPLTGYDVHWAIGGWIGVAVATVFYIIVRLFKSMPHVDFDIDFD